MNRAFLLGIALNVIFVVIEAGFGLYADSLALLADASHNLVDVLSLVLAWTAAWLARSRPTARRTYGLRRATNLASLISSFALLIAIGGIAWEAIGRFSSPMKVDGSIMIVVATDAPIDHRNLERLADRALFGLARTGSSASNGSGDYVIAFATHPDVRRTSGRGVRQIADLGNGSMSALFQAVIEATEEAIYNSMFMATSITGPRGTIDPLSLDRLQEILEQYGVVAP